MEWENCKRKNELIEELTYLVGLAKLNRNTSIIAEALIEVDKPPEVLITDATDPSSSSSSSEQSGQ